MPLDPLSLASSIATFIDGAYKLTKTFSKIPENNRRLCVVKAEAQIELASLQTFLRTQSPSLDFQEAAELKIALFNLQKHLLNVGRQCEAHLMRKRRALTSAPSSLKAWLNSGSTEIAIHRLENEIRSCRLRFMSFSSIRTEFNLITKHQENLGRLEHIEDLVSYMLIRNAQPNVRISTQNDFRTPAIDGVDINFLQRQIRKILASAPLVKPRWQTTLEPPVDIFTASVSPLLQARSASFQKALVETLRAMRMVTLYTAADGCIIQDFTLAIVTATDNISASFTPAQLTVSIQKDLMDLTELAADLSQTLYSVTQCDSFTQMEAFCLYHISVLSNRLGDSKAPSYAERAVNAWQARFDRVRDYTSLYYLIGALCQYTWTLHQRGNTMDAFDCSRQALVLLRTLPELRTDGNELISCPSSEKNRVPISSYEYSAYRPAAFAFYESMCLWSMAGDLTFDGLGENARIPDIVSTSTFI
ncbi:hypothetical protein HGRIS_013943 [Hohenbuehelia grisea]|uniref:Fungal N-terminal domain-containing protein n=1 Tax=Hohenbuehelia grisea TaxID=104357 RepID=A0ABR3JTW0_9AGAR